jgi:fumarate hydratase class II
MNVNEVVAILASRALGAGQGELQLPQNERSSSIMPAR